VEIRAATSTATRADRSTEGDVAVADVEGDALEPRLSIGRRPISTTCGVPELAASTTDAVAVAVTGSGRCVAVLEDGKGVGFVAEASRRSDVETRWAPSPPPDATASRPLALATFVAGSTALRPNVEPMSGLVAAIKNVGGVTASDEGCAVATRACCATTSGAASAARRVRAVAVEGVDVATTDARVAGCVDVET
jgi:hypothetical protein